VAAEHRKAEESLAVATLLTASGGYLDAFTWLAHGHVLANTQSANVVLLGVHAALGDWAQAFRHVPPIIAFVLGVCAAIGLRSRDGDGKRRRPRPVQHRRALIDDQRSATSATLC
jgi:uncharacterized membrane protein YoaK (UPF0700 family)